jgi:D-alanyl-D-alanine carboxypeptidase/D-alanyl-D-alanine-endopeptidase (penicillin-binding protein 4)
LLTFSQSLLTRRILRRNGTAATALLLVCCGTLLLPGILSGQHPVPQSRQAQSIAQFNAQVDTALSDARAQKASWGILVMDSDTGETIYELNADRYFAPASNAKIFATSLALATLGRDYRYRTTLESNAALTSDGRLASDLILIGRGDPDLSNRKFPFEHKAERDGTPDKVLADLVDQAVAKGLKSVDGDIVADDTYYPYDPYPAGWTMGDLFFSFGAPIDAIDFNDNTIGIDVVPGAQAGDPVSLGVQPDAARESFDAQITTSTAGTKADLAVVRQSGPDFILLRGTVPAGVAAIHLEIAMTQPAETAARALKQLLESRGVMVRGNVRALHSPPPVVDAAGLPGKADASVSVDSGNTVLAEHLSQPLLESIRLTNKISQNLHAEMFLREVGRQKYGTGSTAAGLFVERNFLRTAGIADGDVALTDASGLSPQDLVTPRATVTLLRYIQTQPWGADFISTLPIAGVDGTLENRFTSGPAIGTMRAKTGSIDNVRVISGYATTRHGASVVFGIFANDNPQHGLDATSTLDAIATAMIDTIGPASDRPKLPAR